MAGQRVHTFDPLCSLMESLTVGHGYGAAYERLLIESREALYLTLDRMKSGNDGPECYASADHPLNIELGEAIEEVETLLYNCNNAAGNTTVDQVTRCFCIILWPMPLKIYKLHCLYLLRHILSTLLKISPPSKIPLKIVLGPSL